MVKCKGNYVHWIYDAYGDCVSSTSEKVGFGLGLSSTIIWMYAQIPQIILIFKTGNTEGISFGFLCFLFLGDVCNLVGAIINGGLITQIITSTWFIIVDGFCNTQYIYFKWIRPRCCSAKAGEDDIVEGNGSRDNSLIPIVPLLASTGVSLMQQHESSRYKNPYKGDML